MTITEFLTEQLDRDEERASSGWSRMGDARWEYTNEGLSVMTPQGVLADIAAKRAIVRHARQAQEAIEARLAEPPGPVSGHVIAYRDVVRLLAQPYAEHPDFDPAWRV